MSHSHAIATVFCVALMSGCVLAEPADNYPFAPLKVINTNDVGNNGSNGSNPDLPPPLPPELVFTEILLDAPSSDFFVEERGEYIEIRNVGEGPADPRAITMILTDLSEQRVDGRIEVAAPFTTEEADAVAALRPIEPGEYFVFVRYENDLVPISDVVASHQFYDFGRYASGPTLKHGFLDEYELALGYRFPDRTVATFDTLKWASGNFVSPTGQGEPVAFEQARALAVDESAEDPMLNDDPQMWCTPPDLFGEVNGNPAQTDSCPER